MTRIVCNNCGIKCYKPSKEINRQLKKGKVKFFCSLSCSQSFNKTTTKKTTINCLWCNNQFESTTHKKSRKCCSVDCARKYSQSFVNKEIHHKSMRLFGDKIKMFPLKKCFTCVICNNSFYKLIKSKEENHKTCSKKCFLELLSKNSRENPNCGGELGYKHYDYKNIKFDSSWEVVLAKWMDDKNIKWERSRKNHMFWWTDVDGNKRRYYPDFYLPKYNLYLDSKNKYKLSKDQFKLDKVLEENKIVLLYGDVEKIIQQINGISLLKDGTVAQLIERNAGSV